MERKFTKKTETNNEIRTIMDRCYKRVLLYEKKKEDETFGRNIKGLARIESSRPYFVSDGITIRTSEIARATDMGVGRNLTAIFSSGLVDMINMSTMERF